ncbi:hypothetical protein DL96DRAFT_1578988 [Flagelloscypha sp. PMI_526]|nr:hypothetical protein DL96DRAFT_1578988 [Flagelloscypha sp. PMI_526]
MSFQSGAPTPAQQVQQQAQQQASQEWVSGQQYQYALTQFRIAHEKVEQQRAQLEEQEKQVAELRARIKSHEGGDGIKHTTRGGSSVDDFSIKTAASQLDKLINRWASSLVQNPSSPLDTICQAILTDVHVSDPDMQFSSTTMQTSCLLRHALSETISEGIINCLIVTNSTEANTQLTRLHEHLFNKDPTVASVWRRQTFSAAVSSCTPELSRQILADNVPSLTKLLLTIPSSNNVSILDSAYDFSRMLHGSNTSSSGDAFYKAFVPELGSALLPAQIELVKRCMKSERGEVDRVGATMFPGLVKISRGPKGSPNPIQTVVRRAQVVCECAVNGGVVGGRPPSQAGTQSFGPQRTTSPSMMSSTSSSTAFSPPPPPPPLLFSQ